MSLLRIVASDLISDQVHREALRENRTLSAMGLVLLREALAARRAKDADTEALLREATEQRLVNIIRGVASDFPPS
jgi:hypothetical protein